MEESSYLEKNMFGCFVSSTGRVYVLISIFDCSTSFLPVSSGCSIASGERNRNPWSRCGTVAFMFPFVSGSKGYATDEPSTCR